MSIRQYVYGPVPSRRFGLSLGIDLVPHKLCCYDCVYCQLGPTSKLSCTRQPLVDADRVIREVEQALDEHPRPQVLTLAGSGEPTLALALPAVVQGLRRVSDLPICLITNGALLWNEEVAEAASRCDLVAPSLDAADPETFARINRPAPGLDFAQMVEGLRQFCHRYQGRCRLEVMLVQGYNDAPESLRALSALTSSLPLEGIDLNTVVRPPAEADAKPLSAAALEQARACFGEACTEIIAAFSAKKPCPAVAPAHAREQLLAMIARRPCTIADLAAGLALAEEQVLTLVDEAEMRDELKREQRGEAIYYRRCEVALTE